MIARRICAALVLLAAALAPFGAFAQVPPPVPALPDSARIQQYTLSGTTCICAVGFQLYADSTDIDAWIQVWVGGKRYLSTNSTYGWSLSSPTGSLATIPRPITDAVLTFNAVQTGTVQIVGARRPRRTSVFQENAGVPARALNQTFNDLFATQREVWDKTNDLSGRGLFFAPGNTAGPMPAPSACKSSYLGFNSTGLNPLCAQFIATPGTIATPGGTTANDPVVWGNTTGNQLLDKTPSSAFDTWYCNTVGYLIVRLTGAWTCSKAIAANPVWWGADPTGTNDSTTAINSAITAGTFSSALGKETYVAFPPGLFKINSQISIVPGSQAGVRIEGAGPLVTVLWFPNASTGIDIDFGTSASVSAHIRDFSMITSGAGNTTGLTLQSETTTGAGYVYGVSDLTNLDFFGASGYGQGDFFSDAIVLDGMSNVSLQNINVYGAGSGCALSLTNTCGVGLLVEKNGTTLANVVNVQSSSFYYLTNGINGVGDVKSLDVQQTSFLGNSIGIASSGSTLGLQWNIGPSDNFTDEVNDIKLANPIINLTVNDDMFLVYVANEIAIDVVATGLVNQTAIIHGDYIACTSASGTEGIYLGPGQINPSMVADNVIEGCGTAILADTSSNLINISNNSLGGNTPPAIINRGTNNIVANNLGFNPVGVTGPTNVPTSPATICAGASPETHYFLQSATNNATVKLGSSSGPLIGTTASATIPVVVDLGPAECEYVTWATTDPTYTKSVH